MKLPLQIDVTNPLPLYAQLEQGIRLAIATGQLSAGVQLPTVRQLAVELRVNANTVARVYTELERAGLLETRRGVGTFVRAVPSEDNTEATRRRHLKQLADRFLMEAARLGYSLPEVLQSLQSDET
jgi:GntR family transcriptional regulator